MKNTSFTARIGLSMLALLAITAFTAVAHATGPPGTIVLTADYDFVNQICSSSDTDVGALTILVNNETSVGNANYTCGAMIADLSGGSGVGAILTNQVTTFTGADNESTIDFAKNYAVTATTFDMQEGTAGFAGGTSPDVNDVPSSLASSIELAHAFEGFDLRRLAARHGDSVVMTPST